MKVTRWWTTPVARTRLVAVSFLVISGAAWLELSYLNSTANGVPSWASNVKPYLWHGIPPVTAPSEEVSAPVPLPDGLSKALGAVFKEEAAAVAKVPPHDWGKATPAAPPLPPGPTPQTDVGRAMVKVVEAQLTAAPAGSRPEPTP